MTLEEIIEDIRKSLIETSDELNYNNAVAVATEVLRNHDLGKLSAKQLAVMVVHGRSPKDILAFIAKEHCLVVHTEYHSQIEVTGGFHDFWLGKNGLKIKLFGQQVATDVTSLSRLRQALKGYDYSTTDRAELMLLNRLITKSKGKKGIFTDAGYDGKTKIARIAAIESTGHGDINLHIRLMHDIENSTRAEVVAITLAMSWFPGEDPIFNDCQQAVTEINHPRVQWIPRESNKVADSFGNMRNKK